MKQLQSISDVWKTWENTFSALKPGAKIKVHTSKGEANLTLSENGVGHTILQFKETARVLEYEDILYAEIHSELEATIEAKP